MKKRAYTDFLKNGSDSLFGHLDSSYLDLPRKEKKKRKRYAEKQYYYERKKGFRRVTFYNPRMLCDPIPKGLMEMFGTPIPIRSSQTVKFTRYSG